MLPFRKWLLLRYFLIATHTSSFASALSPWLSPWFSFQCLHSSLLHVTAVAHQGFTVPAPGHGSWVLSPCLLLSGAGFCCGSGNFSPPGGNQSLQQRAKSSLSRQGVLTYPSLLSKCILWVSVQLVPSTAWGWASCCLHALKATVLCKRK